MPRFSRLKLECRASSRANTLVALAQACLKKEDGMNRDCEKGLQLRLHFEHALKEWGWFDAYERALELMPVCPPQVHVFQMEARHAQAELYKARHAYVEHMSECLACSKRLITPDALDTIRERLRSIVH